MNQQLKNIFKDTSYYMTNHFPFVFCIAVCMGIDLIIAFSFCLISILFIPEINNKKMMPLIISFLIIGLNPEYALSSSVICGFLLIISSFFADKIKNLLSSPTLSGVMLAGALTVTVLFTTDYFGIGATGCSVAEMIKSYISLGFHPNWRGVLYGTIVLVIMVTFPRKFKSFDKYVSAPFIALIFTLILNLFLNPSDMISAINEISPSEHSEVKEYFISRLGFLFDYNAILIGFALFITFFYSVSSDENAQKKDYITCGLINIVLSGLCGIPIPHGTEKKISNPLSKLLAITILIISYVLFKDLIIRIPLHSCAVVVIVTAWNNVKWREIKKQFGGIVPFAFFVVSAITSSASNLVFGIVISFAISALYSRLKLIKR